MWVRKSTWKGLVTRGLLGLMPFWLVLNVFAQITFKAYLDRDTVILGEEATLTLEFENASLNNPLRIPDVPGLVIRYSGHSQNITSMNGKSTQVSAFTYSVVPEKIGEFTIPAIQVKGPDSILTSKPLKLKVLNAQQSGSQQDGSSQDPTDKLAFVNFLVTKTNLYVGEAMPVEVRVFYQDIKDLSMPQVIAEGFVVGTNVVQNQGRSRVNNQIYNGYSFGMTVVPVKEGDLKLGPVECALNLIVYQNGGRSRDPFGMFFGNQGSLVPVTKKAQAQVIHVLPLPKENVPEGFNGAVGNYTMNVAAGPTNLAVGDPITVKIQISGSGSLDVLNMPDIPWGTDFKVQLIGNKIEKSDQLGIQGSKTFEYLVIPQKPDIQSIPEICFSFYNTETKQYQRLTNQPISIVVQKTLGAAQNVTLGQSQESRQARERERAETDIVNIKMHPGQLGIAISPWLYQPWFWMLQALPVLAMAGVLGWQAYQNHLALNPRIRRRQQVEKQIAKGIGELRKLSRSGQKEEFFAMAFRLLQEALGERLNLPAVAITESVVDEKLRPAGVPEELLKNVHEVFLMCNQARYAGSMSDLNEACEKVQEAIHEVQKIQAL